LTLNLNSSGPPIIVVLHASHLKFDFQRITLLFIASRPRDIWSGLFKACFHLYLLFLSFTFSLSLLLPLILLTNLRSSWVLSVLITQASQLGSRVSREKKRTYRAFSLIPKGIK
jgi:hypothetical protein